jgi:hypothetical protein
MKSDIKPSYFCQTTMRHFEQVTRDRTDAQMKISSGRHFLPSQMGRTVARRAAAFRLIRIFPPFKHGTVRAIATVLGVSVATIIRDIQAILRIGRPCQHCGAPPIIGPDPAEDELADLDGWEWMD